MIQKNIFQSWKTTNLHPRIQKITKKIKLLNPNYAYHLYTDKDMDDFVNENYKGEIAECYNRLNIIVAKVDFWRYLVLYKYGGIYLDMDSDININLDKFIRSNDDAIITAEGNPNMFVQWGLIFSKGHYILKRTIDLIVCNIKNNRFPNDIHKMTGPSIYSKAINEVHYEVFKHRIIHKKIKKHTDITYNNDKTSYSIDYDNKFTFKHHSTKYLSDNTKHWTEEQKIKPLLL